MTFSELPCLVSLPEAFFVGPPLKEKLPKVLLFVSNWMKTIYYRIGFWLVICDKCTVLQNAPPGAVLLGSISYGTVTLNNKNDTKNNQQSPASYHISYLIPSSKVRMLVYHITVFFFFFVFLPVNIYYHEANKL